METTLRKHLGKNSLAIAALCFAAQAPTSIVRGQITWVKNITGAGGSPGYFNYPSGVAVSPTGEIYVVDRGNNRVEKFFNPAEWVSGAPHFDGAAVGYGQVLGPSVTLDTTHGLLVDGAMTIQSGGSLTVNPGGNITAGSFTNGGTYSVNGGTVLVTGGMFTNNAAMTLNGGTLLADGPLASITASLVYASSFSSTYQGILAGSGNSLTLDNPAALLILIGSSNSFTGGTNVEAGTLEITSAGALPGGTSLTVGAGAAFAFDPSLASAPVTNTAATVTVPEPGTLALLGVGALGLLAYTLRKRLQAAAG